MWYVHVWVMGYWAGCERYADKDEAVKHANRQRKLFARLGIFYQVTSSEKEPE